ncbi:MAG: hypothetical protein ACI4FZ_04880 [Lachnospiraceae bacterium]
MKDEKERKEKKEKFFQKLNQDKRLQVIFFVLSMLVLFAGYFAGERWILYRKITHMEPIEDLKIRKKIECAKTVDGKITLSGWILRVDSQNLNVKLLLKEEDTGKIKVLKTSQMERDDMGEYSLKAWNYGKTGFKANISSEKLKEDVCYEILFYYTYMLLGQTYAKLVPAGNYLLNGEMYDCSPHTLTTP